MGAFDIQVTSLETEIRPQILSLNNGVLKSSYFHELLGPCILANIGDSGKILHLYIQQQHSDILRWFNNYSLNN